jgi:haloalkane dehalogenase
MMVYKQPYPTIKSRKPLRQWPCEIPIDGKPARMQKIVQDYSTKLQESSYPKLLLYGTPGGLITGKGVQWCEKHLKNLKKVELGKGLHYLQEDHPHKIGDAIAGWLQQSWK